MSFLSQETFEEIRTEAPEGGRYINPSKHLTEEDRRLRFVGPGITGFEAWTTEDKPIRWEQKPAELPDNIKPDLKGRITSKRFIAGVVWDYAEDNFKILQITQRSIMEQLDKFVKDSEYGDPLGYDIKLSKKGKGLDTEYTLIAAPPKPLHPDIQEAFDASGIKINAMFEQGGDPFPADS